MAKLAEHFYFVIRHFNLKFQVGEHTCNGLKLAAWDHLKRNKLKGNDPSLGELAIVFFLLKQRSINNSL